jgi:hypothetical protein
MATSASITQSGNTFTINQNVALACTLPSNPTVASEFDVGTLPGGSYTVTAMITFTSLPPLSCPHPPVSQTATFAVSPSVIPAVDGRLLVLLALTLAAVAFVKLKA